jgi:thiol-disulfide isomerase/thioredoxin
MKFKVLAFFAICAILLFQGCESKDNTSQKKVIKKEKLTVFKLKTNDGKEIKAIKSKNGMIFRGYEDKAVLVNFFATWCHPCKAEIPHLNNLRKKYDGKFEIIAILLEENKDKQILNAFMTTYNIKYPVTNSQENFKFAEYMDSVKTIPTMFMYAKGGELIEKYVGIVPQEMLESDIKKGLGI